MLAVRMHLLLKLSPLVFVTVAAGVWFNHVQDGGFDFVRVITWLWAVYVMAYLVAGLPAFFGFSEFAWVALVGHVLFGWAAAAVIRSRLG